MAIQLIGQDLTTVLKVDSGSNAARFSEYDASGNILSVPEQTQPTIVSGKTMFGLNDRAVVPIRVDRFGNLGTARHNVLLHESFEGATPNAIRWTILTTTYVVTQTTIGGYTMNTTSLTTINTGSMLQSTKAFVKAQRAPLHMRTRVRLINKASNSIFEAGFNNAATLLAAPSAGAYWQSTAAGVLQPVVTYNSTDITGTDVSGLINSANFYVFDVMITDDIAIFTIQDSGTGLIINRQEIPCPITSPRLLSVTALPVTIRLFNSGTAPTLAPQLVISDVYVLMLDAELNAPIAHQTAGMDRSTLSNPFTGAQLAQWTNSAEPASATLSNTAAGYTTLGGKFQFVAPVGAVTDFALFGFQVPVGSNLFITGIDIETWVTGAASATTPTLLTWAVAAGSTAVSLATATVMRRPLGAQSIPVGSAIGFAAPRISKKFDTPLYVSNGRFLHIILRVPVGTATASEVIAGMVNIEGYFL